MSEQRNKLTKINIIIACICALNIIVLLCYSIIKLNITNNKILAMIFLFCFTLIPLSIIILSIINYHDNALDIKIIEFKKDYFIFIPMLSFILIKIITGVKIILGLDKIAIGQMIIILLTFILLDITTIFMLKDKKYSFKRYCIYSIISFVILLLFIGCTLIMTYDYSLY